MKKYIFLIVIISFSTSLYSQAPRKIMERIQTIKKVKLLEELDLEENKADKLLLKYNSFEDKFTEKIQEFDEIEKQLEEAISDNNQTEIKELTAKFLKIKDDLMSISSQKDSAIQEILNDKEFAKYIIFEKRFKKELSGEILRRGRRKR